jgi:hypothetical protein
MLGQVLAQTLMSSEEMQFSGSDRNSHALRGIVRSERRDIGSRASRKGSLDAAFQSEVSGSGQS